MKKEIISNLESLVILLEAETANPIRVAKALRNLIERIQLKDKWDCQIQIMRSLKGDPKRAEEIKSIDRELMEV